MLNPCPRPRGAWSNAIPDGPPADEKHTTMVVAVIGPWIRNAILIKRLKRTHARKPLTSADHRLGRSSAFPITRPARDNNRDGNRIYHNPYLPAPDHCHRSHTQQYAIIVYSRPFIFLQRRRANTFCWPSWPCWRSNSPPSCRSPSVRSPWSPVKPCCLELSHLSCPWSESCRRCSASNTRRPSPTRWSHNTTTKFTVDTTLTAVPEVPTSRQVDTVVRPAAVDGDAASTPNRWLTAPKHRRHPSERPSQTWVSGPAFATSAAYTTLDLLGHAHIICTHHTQLCRLFDFRFRFFGAVSSRSPRVDDDHYVYGNTRIAYTYTTTSCHNGGAAQALQPRRQSKFKRAI